jgi:hypothetical protein
MKVAEKCFNSLTDQRIGMTGDRLFGSRNMDDRVTELRWWIQFYLSFSEIQRFQSVANIWSRVFRLLSVTKLKGPCSS